MDNEYYMREALKEAKRAYEMGEIPIGCVIVKNDKIISRGYNKKEIKNDSTSHAEINSIQKASKKLGWRLSGCQMYVTLEPCPMCAGAIIQSRIKTLFIGTMDAKGGAVGSVLNLLKDYKFNHNVEIISGILKDECSMVLKTFFRELRDKNSKTKGE